MARVSTTHFAERMGVSRKAVHKAIASERLKSWGRDEAGRIWIEDDAAAAEWARNTDPVEAAKNGKFWLTPDLAVAEMPAGAAPVAPVASEVPQMAPSTSAPEETDYQAARTSRERANADLAHLELQKQLGTLVSKAEVEKASFAVARVVRDAFMTLPDRLAPRLAAESDLARIHADLENEIRYILNGLSDRLPAAAAQGSD